MTETQLLMELVKNVGFPAVIFIIWYLYHRAQVKAWGAQMQTMNDHETRMFNLLNGQLEALQCIVAQNARMETKIDSSMFCPIVRKESHA